jgi:hypothetical protein
MKDVVKDVVKDGRCIFHVSLENLMQNCRPTNPKLPTHYQQQGTPYCRHSGDGVVPPC